jgi:hypothetical protein
MIARRDLQNQTSLDSYSEESTKNGDVILVKVNSVNLNVVKMSLPAEPARHIFAFKVEELVKAVRDLMARDNYARDGRLYDTLVMRGIVASGDEYMRLKKIAHHMGLIKEQGIINGAWVANWDRFMMNDKERAERVLPLLGWIDVEFKKFFKKKLGH